MSADAERCANCGAPLSGTYCSACGQRADHHVLSIGEFLGEALEVFTHADSRFWRTFLPLLTRPGYLTQQFIAGRRVSYLPPFRLYIVLSVVFFLVVPLTAAPTVALTPQARAAAVAKVHADLQQQIDAARDPAEKLALQRQLRDVTVATDTFVPAPGGAAPCAAALERATAAGGTMPAWLKQRVTTACERIGQDNGRELGHSLLHNLGRAMLVLLPLLAALMQLLYLGQHRHYVEHLLLLLHNHAFVFLTMSVLLLVTHLANSDLLDTLLGWLFVLYAAWYLYESMRRVYGQGRVATFFKFCTLGAGYFFCALLMLAATTIYSAATL